MQPPRLYLEMLKDWIDSAGKQMTQSVYKRRIFFKPSRGGMVEKGVHIETRQESRAIKDELIVLANR